MDNTIIPDNKSHDEPQFMSRTNKHITSVAIYYCTFALGVGFTFLSPTVTDFEQKYNTNTAAVSIAFTVLTFCYLIGALTYGILTSFIRRHFLVMALLSLMSVSLFVLPHLSSIMVFYVFSGLLGFGAGTYDTSQIAWMIDIWREEAGPFILSQHFAFSVGTIVPPLLLGPFLTEEEDDEDDDNNNKITTTTTTNSYWSSSSSEMSKKESDLTIPFSVAGGILALAVLVQVLLFIRLSTSKKSKNGQTAGLPEKEDKSDPLSLEKYQEDKDKGEEGEEEITEPKLVGFASTKRRTLILVIISCCVLGPYQGMEVTTMQFIPTFAVKAAVDLTKAQGANVLFGFTLAYSIGRLCGIIIVLKVKPHFLIFANFTLILISNIILLVWGQDSVKMLWTACIIMGAGMSTFYPSYYAFIEPHLHVTDKIAASIVVSGGFISAIYPIIVGTSVEDTPAILTYVNFFSLAMCLVFFSITFYLTMIRKGKK